MKVIELRKIEKNGNTVAYDFSCSEELRKYFTGVTFSITYPESIEQVPDGVLAIPFATNTLQIAWLTDSELILPELDRDFYESIPKFLAGFQNMYPEARFAGKLTVGRVVDHRPEKRGQRGTFFSGGLDATCTLLRHLEERPHLICMWGADVAYDNAAGWATVKTGLKETAEQFGLPLAVIRSRFREFDNVVSLTEDFQEILQASWWYGVKHGIGLIGHAAPYAWLHGMDAVYIASSNSPEDGKVRCASDPTIDNYVEFCGSRVVHDAYERNRQEKADDVVRYRKEHPQAKIKLRVCWKSDRGTNCCSCEKCYRTMIGLWISGEDPKDYGFQYDKNIFSRIYRRIALHETSEASLLDWVHLRDGLRDRWDLLENKKYRNRLKWMLDFDFIHPEENKCRKRYRATWRYKQKMVDAFPRLYARYVKLRGYRYE